MTFYSVQNDKSVRPQPPVAGTVTAVLVSEGTVAHVGDVIVEIWRERFCTNMAAPTFAPSSNAPAAPAAPVPGKQPW